MAAEAMVVDMEQHIYTRGEVERLLWFHLGRRPILTTHGRTVARYGSGPYVCPRCLGDAERRKSCRSCNRTGRVVDVMPAGTSTVSVPDALLSKADLLRAMWQLDLKHRTLLFLFYTGEYSPERIAHMMRRHNGGVVPSVRTLWRWRARAVDYLIAALNRTYARKNA